MLVQIVTLDQLSDWIQAKSSQLCVGLDPRVPAKDRTAWALNLIEETADFAVAYKPNRQFWLGTPRDEIKQITNLIHANNAIAIIDHKLSDIGSSNEAAIKWAASEGFDFITVSPFPGNLEEVCQLGEQYGIGVISLVLMSNPEAKYLTDLDYGSWAEITSRYNGGIVIGTTNHINEEHIKTIAERFSDGFILAPGLGKQGGKVGLVLDYFEDRAIFNVSRGISQADDPVQAARSFVDEINQLATQ